MNALEPSNRALRQMAQGSGGAAVGVMAKVPRPGLVKTRLARALGAEVACDLYRAFVIDLDERLSRLELPALWFHWPADSGFANLVDGATAVMPQRGADLGERMANAFADGFRMGFGPVVMLGADVPHVPLDRLADGTARLASGADVVLGAAADGGYYLLGLRGPAVALFREIEWGSSNVYRVTLARAAAAGLRVEEVPAWFDLDEPDDLARLAGGMSPDDTTYLPRTRAILAATGFVPGAD